MSAAAAIADWPVLRVAPELKAGEMHVWRVPLAISTLAQESGAACLDPEEQRRATAYRFERHRRHFVACRAAQRTILGSYLQVAPERVVFEYLPLGKPRLSVRRAGETIEFNVTNSGEWALLSIARKLPHGVDLEHVGRRCDHVALAERYFAPEERHALAKLPESDRREAFFRCWTRKEAVLKATGTGLTFPLDRFVVTLSSHEPPRMLSIEGCPTRAAGWTLASFQPAVGYQAALAWQTSDALQLHTMSWSHEEV